MEGFPRGQREQTVNLLAPPSVVRIHLPPPNCRGVEQLAARRAHNPKVVGSNPASATNDMYAHVYGVRTISVGVYFLRIVFYAVIRLPACAKDLILT